EGEATRRRHAEHYAELADEIGAEHPGSRSGAAWRELEAEQDNFRAALEWCRDSGAVELELRLVGALAYFWATSDHLREGRARVDAALSQAEDAAAPLRAKLVWGPAPIADRVADEERSRASVDALLALFSGYGDKRQ